MLRWSSLLCALLLLPAQARPLRPSASFTTYLGGSGGDLATAVELDRAGNIYVAGSTDSGDFPATTVFTGNSSRGNGDIFLTKFDPTGRNVLWSTILGGSGSDTVADLVVDSQGNCYLTGTTTSKLFPTTPNALNPRFRGGSYDGFVTKIGPNGDQLLYSTFLGGSSDDLINGIALSGGGTVTVVGETSSFDTQVTPGAFDTTFNDPSSLGGSDVFISKLDATGSSLVYATYLGGSAGDFGKRIALDGTGAVYVTGQTFSLDYPTTPGSFQTSATANTNEAFVTKLDPTGSRLIYSTFLGGAEGLDAAYGLGVDSTGAAVVFGFTGSSDFPATGGTFHPNNFDVFVAKFTPSGDALAWANFLGGSNEEDAYNLALDRAGNVYVTGQTASSDFPVTANALDPTKNSAFDAFVTQFTPTGNLAYSTYLGSSGYDGGLGLTVDKMGSVYVVGTVGDLDLPTTLGSYDPTYNGNGDAFLSKIKVQP